MTDSKNGVSEQARATRLVREISSPQNPLIREVTRLLTKSKARRADGRCVIEGLREVERAARAGVIIETLLYRPDLTSAALVEEALRGASPPPKDARRILEARCSDVAFRKVAYRADVPNLVAVARRPAYDTLRSLASALGDASAPPLLLVLEGIEKPGNLGAMLRTADALGVTGVILIDCDADPDHPNSVRNSLGATFSLEVAVMSFEEVEALLREHAITPYVTHLHTHAIPLGQLRLDQPCALILGAEATGVSDRWIERLGAQPTLIPMRAGRVVDSLNVSVAAALVVYEAMRQRGQL